MSKWSIKKILYKLLNNQPAFVYCNTIAATTITAQTTSQSANPKLVKLTDGITSSVGEPFTFNSSNGSLVCQRAGIYIASLSVRMDTVTSGNLIGLRIYKNNTSIIGPAYTRMGGNDDCAFIFPTAFSCNVGDYLQIYIQNNSAASGTTATSCRLVFQSIKLS